MYGGGRTWGLCGANVGFLYRQIEGLLQESQNVRTIVSPRLAFPMRAPHAGRLQSSN